MVYLVRLTPERQDQREESATNDIMTQLIPFMQDELAALRNKIMNVRPEEKQVDEQVILSQVLTEQNQRIIQSLSKLNQGLDSLLEARESAIQRSQLAQILNAPHSPSQPAQQIRNSNTELNDDTAAKIFTYQLYFTFGLVGVLLLLLFK